MRKIKFILRNENYQKEREKIEKKLKKGMRITYIFTRLREKKNTAHQNIILEILREFFILPLLKKT